MTDLLAFAAVVGRITIWQASLPEPKPSYFSCADLTMGTGLSMRQLYLPLIALGWSRAEVWHRPNGKRVRRVYYAPPGQQVPRPPRGRPSFNIDDYIKITYP